MLLTSMGKEAGDVDRVSLGMCQNNQKQDFLLVLLIKYELIKSMLFYPSRVYSSDSNITNRGLDIIGGLLR